MPNEYESGLEGYGIGGGEAEAAAPPEPSMFAGMGHFGRNAAGTGYDVGPFTPLATGIDTGLLHAAALAASIPAEDTRTETGGIGTLYAFSQQKPDDEATSNAKRQEYARQLLDTAKRIQPDARTTGSAYRLFHSVADFGTRLAIGSAGGPLGMVSSAGGISAFEAYHQAKDDGLDDATAQRMAGAEGFTSGLFGLVPGAGAVLSEGASAGGKALIDAALGVGTNVPLGMTNRYLNHKILESAGYPALAVQYRTLDGTAMFADAAMGLLPLGAHLLAGTTGKALDIARRVGARDSLVKDAADVVNLQRVDLSLAPGIPADAGASAAHEEAMRVGMEQVLRDQPVDLESTRMARDGATFVGRPAEPENMELAMTVFAEHLQESGVAEQLAQLEGRDRQDVDRAGIPIPEKPPSAPSMEEAGFEPATPEEIAAHTAAVTGQTPLERKRAAKLAKLEKVNTAGKRRYVALIPDARKDSALEYLAKTKEGIDAAEAVANGLDARDIANSAAARFGIFRTFRKQGGLSMDGVAERLGEAGYPTLDAHGRFDASKALDLIQREMAGQKVYSHQRDYDAANLLTREERVEKAAAKVPEIRQATPEEQDLAPIFAGLDEDEGERFAIRYEDADAQERATMVREAQEKIDAKENTAATAKGVGLGTETPSLELARESPDELAARGRAESAAAAAEQQSLLNVAERDRGERELRQPFSLLGSDRPADANPNQTDLIEQITKEAAVPEIPGADGVMHDAEVMSAQLEANEAQAKVEAAKAFAAAANCFNRGGD